MVVENIRVERIEAEPLVQGQHNGRGPTLQGPQSNPKQRRSSQILISYENIWKIEGLAFTYSH